MPGEYAYRSAVVTGSGASQLLLPKNERRVRLIIHADTTNTFWWLNFGRAAVASDALVLLTTGQSQAVFDARNGDVFIRDEVFALANAAGFVITAIEVIEL